MAINGIGSNSFFDYSSSVNQIKLQQAINKNTSKDAGSIGSTDKTVDTYNHSSGYKDSLSFLKDYNSSMTDLMSSANTLRDVNASGVFKSLEVSSSNADVMSVSKNYNLRGSSGSTYDVNVEQLAAAQMNTSSGAVSTGKAAADISLNIINNSNNISINVSKTGADGVEKTNKQLLQDAAKEINTKAIGIQASVVEKDGKSSLQLVGETGKKNAFLVSGNFADQAGLATASQVAADARYSVKTNGGSAREYTSASNKVSLEYGKISATLNKTGTSAVSVGADSTKVVSAVEDLVKNYNSTLKVLNDNADRGTGVTKQLRSMLSGFSSEKTMEMVGITTKKDGTLELDKAKLTKSLAKDPQLTKDVLAGSYGIAQSAFQKGVSGLQASNTSLINQDLSNIAEQRAKDPINIMNMYSRNSAYSMMNYAASGMLFNMYV